MPAVTPDLIAQHAPLAALASRYIDIDSMPWRDTRWPTIKSKVLMEDKERGLATILMHWQPGTEFPEHEHVEIEQTYVLEGSFEDSQGVCRAGQFVWRPAGSRHTARSVDGCLMLAFFLKPNKFFDQPEIRH
jgi:anti-sigma factor ChrR (cupin superfamily)